MQQDDFPKTSNPALRTLNGAGYFRLEPAGSWNSIVTHRVKISAAKEIDADVLEWLKRAYDTV